MDGERSFSSGKRKSGSFRNHSRSQFDNGKRKRHNVSHDHSAVSAKPIDTVYRILCPVKKIGSVLGKGGDIVNALREETHAKIRVADAIPGAEERVIIIFSYPTTESDKLESDWNPEDDEVSEKEHGDMWPHCPAQDALLKVHDRISADEYILGGVVHENIELDDTVTARILVPSNQVGCLLGKGGTVIQRLRSDTGASIRILPAENLPPCAMTTDELVQISGMPHVVKKAVYEISTLLHQHPRKENPSLEDLIYASTQGLYGAGHPMPPPPSLGNPIWSHHPPNLHIPPPIPLPGGFRSEPHGFVPGGLKGSHGESGDSADEFSMRILCPTEKIGGVIGKGGANVRQLEQQTGALIQVEDTDPEAEERIILVSCMEAHWDPLSPTIDAVLQLQGKTCVTSEKGTITTRLLVPSSKVGCLLGQGGNIITEMRMRSHADIRVYSKDDKPKYTSANEELVQISGHHSVAKEALVEIASRLRERTLRGTNAVNAVPTDSYRLYPPENFSGRGPTSGMIRSGSADYSRPKHGGQVYDARGYPGPRTDDGYPGPQVAAGYQGPLATYRYPGPQAAAGYRGPPIADGYRGPPIADGYRGTPIADGYRGPPMADGYRGPPMADGYRGPPMADGYRGPPMVDGHRGPPMADGYRGPPMADGFPGQQAPAGYSGHRNAGGYSGRPSTSVYPGLPTAAGYPVMSSSMEVKIPNSAVAAVLGTGGSNVSEIRQISGARVKLRDPLPGASDCIVEIHGSSDQMKAAQSLLQAFIASGGENAPPPPLQAPRPYQSFT